MSILEGFSFYNVRVFNGKYHRGTAIDNDTINSVFPSATLAEAREGYTRNVCVYLVYEGRGSVDELGVYISKRPENAHTRVFLGRGLTGRNATDGEPIPTSTPPLEYPNTADPEGVIFTSPAHPEARLRLPRMAHNDYIAMWIKFILLPNSGGIEADFCRLDMFGGRVI